VSKVKGRAKLVTKARNKHTHKYGIEVSKTMIESTLLDKKNGDTQ